MPRRRRRGHRLRARLTAEQVIEAMIAGWSPEYSEDELAQLRDAMGKTAFRCFMAEKENYNERSEPCNLTD